MTQKVAITGLHDVLKVKAYRLYSTFDNAQLRDVGLGLGRVHDTKGGHNGLE